MPTPELYMMYAMIADSRAMMDAMRSLTIGNRNHVNLAKQMHQIFRYTLPCVGEYNTTSDTHCT